jgi:hypothetical protein
MIRLNYLYKILFSRYVFAGVLGPIVLIIIFVIIINILQAYKLNWLPSGLRTWLWLPRPLRTLAWYDENLFGKQWCCRCCRKKKDDLMTINGSVYTNESYIDDQNSNNI